MQEPELIVFVDENGHPTGETGPKLESHHADTKLHLAFSCYIFRNKDKKFLVTQRAVTKKVWPGVWTNSVCGHPMPGESLEGAITRRAAYEIGLNSLRDTSCVLPKYIYKTPPFKGIIEHEFCPIFVAYTDEEPKPNPEEVEAYKWLTWPEYVAMLETEADKMSYWCKDQYKQLKDLEPFKSLSLLQ